MVDIASIAPGLALREDGIRYSADGRRCRIRPKATARPSRSRTDRPSPSQPLHRRRGAGVPPPASGTILDIGGGNGFVARGRLDAGLDTVLEPSNTGAHNAQRRGVRPIICATTETARLRDDSLPAVGLFDVIEHLEDEVAFLRALRACAAAAASTRPWVPGPVVERRRRRPFRRHTRAAIARTIAGAGFAIDFTTHIFRPLPLPIFLFRTLPDRLGIVSVREKKKRNDGEHRVRGGAISHALDHVLAAEVRKISAARPMRFGGSCLVVAHAV